MTKPDSASRLCCSSSRSRPVLLGWWADRRRMNDLSNRITDLESYVVPRRLQEERQKRAFAEAVKQWELRRTGRENETSKPA